MENTNNAVYESTREHVYAVAAKREKDAAGLTQALHLISPSPPPPPMSQHPAAITAHPNASAWVTRACRLRSSAFGFCIHGFHDFSVTHTFMCCKTEHFFKIYYLSKKHEAENV